MTTTIHPPSSTLKPPTYPARPVNGGPLDKAQPKHGRWCWEPKYNGWRTLVHVPTGTMFNRHGQRLSIEKEFAPALAWLKQREAKMPTWLDCEALERRHNIGRGSLIVLDYLPEKPLDYEYRRFTLSLACGLREHCDLEQPVAHNSVYLVASYPGKNRDEWESGNQQFQLWSILKQCNEHLSRADINPVLKNQRIEFYEGLVAKRADSLYPIQLRSHEQEFPFWMKHRWQF